MFLYVSFVETTMQQNWFGTFPLFILLENFGDEQNIREKVQNLDKI